MKDERMAILSMLEKGVINADEAERLLNTLQNSSFSASDLGDAVQSAMNKAGVVLDKVAKKANEAAEKMQPKVMEAASVVREKGSALKEEAIAYKERLKEKHAQAEDDFYEDISEVCAAEDAMKQNLAQAAQTIQETAADVVETTAEAVENAAAKVEETISSHTEETPASDEVVENKKEDEL